MKKIALALRYIEEALRELQFADEVVEFEVNTHLTHAQRNGLTELHRHLINKSTIHMRSAQSYLGTVQQERKTEGQDIEELPF
jgi:hypothetical protein